MEVAIHEALKTKVIVGVLRLTDIASPEDEGAAIFKEIEKSSTQIHAKNMGKTAGQVEGVQRARQLYRSIGIDPTKTRPSSEALLRRVLKGKSLYRIHPLVDLFNLVSLETLTPVGLYDESKIAGALATIRIGGPDEGFEGIRKGRVNLAGRFLIADAEGPFGSPTSDSLRTSVAGHVSDALAVFYQSATGDLDHLHRALVRAETLAAGHLKAQIRVKTVVGH